MKINNKSKVAMNIFHQARRQIALIACLLGLFADAALWKISWQMDLLFFWLCLNRCYFRNIYIVASYFHLRFILFLKFLTVNIDIQFPSYSYTINIFTTRNKGYSFVQCCIRVLFISADYAHEYDFALNIYIKIQ